MLFVPGTRRRWDAGLTKIATLIAGEAIHLRVTQVFEKNETGDNVTIVGGRIADDLSLFFQPAGDPIQRLIGHFIRRWAVLTVEVKHQPAAYFKVTRTSGIFTGVEPIKKPVKRALGQRPMLLRISLSARRLRHGS